jgi:TRAP-type C4-dicarboxylate transport system permease small subunit
VSVFKRIVDTISKILGLISMGFILPMMLLVVAAVIARYVFKNPITGAAEISITIMLFLPLAIPWCAVQNQHIKIDEILKRFPKRVAGVIDIITLTIGMGMSGLIAWKLFESFLYEFGHTGQISLMLPIPTYPFWFLVFLAWAVMTLVLLTHVIGHVYEAVKR